MDFPRQNYRSYAFIEWRRGKNYTQIYEQLQEAGLKNGPTKMTVCRWLQRFADGSTSFSDAPRSGRPSFAVSEENVERVRLTIQEEPRRSLRDLAEEIGVSKDTVLRILTDHLSMRKVCSTWVPYRLNQQQKDARINCAQSLIELLNEYSFDDCMKFWVTEDETWILFTPLATKQENKAWVARGEPKPKVVRPAMTNRKAMILMAFTGDGKISIESVASGETVTSERYVDFVRHTGDKWRTLRSSPTRLAQQWWQHDNARPHTAASTRDFFRQRQVKMIEQSPYSPDMNQCDRWVFKDLKKHLRKSLFSSGTEIINESLHFFRSLPKEKFSSELQRLHDHCNDVIRCAGDYVDS